MIQNRTIPYGYKKEMGKIKINIEESKIIKRIYLEYAQGESYKKIAESLTAEKINYLENKAVWNKNMIARILQNNKYLGTEEYPQIICEEIKQDSVLAQKTYTHTESTLIKHIKPLLMCDVCGGKIKRRLKTSGVERWYCENDTSHISVKMSDSIIEDDTIYLIKTKLKDYEFTQSNSNRTTMEIIELQNKIDKELISEEIDVDKLHTDIKKLAELKYEILDDTIHMKINSLDKLKSNPIENIGELKYILKEIYVNNLELKNIILVNGVKL